jgi:hypothetical protein
MMILYMIFIVVGRIATGRLRLKNRLDRDEEMSVRKFSKRKCSEIGQKMAAVILSHHPNTLSFRMSFMVKLVTL